MPTSVRYVPAFDSVNGLESQSAERAFPHLSEISDGLAALEQAHAQHGPFATPQNRVGALIQSFLASSEAPKSLRPIAESTGLEVKFDERDILGWVGSLLDWMKQFRRRDFISAETKVEELSGSSLDFGVVSDWGTGLYGAPVVSKTMESDKTPFSLLLHLGDVYYSGTKEEVRKRFLAIWPKRRGCISRALNANHEMYSGGEGYFDEILKSFDQRASYFCYRFQDWLIVGLDTAYEDHSLAGKQAEWLRTLNNENPECKIVLFSHHQPFSLLDKQGPKLTQAISDLLLAKRVYAWYWGHEHRCVVYDRHPVWGFHGRCVGHGGFPYFRDNVSSYKLEEKVNGCGWYRLPSKNLVPSALLLDGPNPFVSGKELSYGPNGFLKLRFHAGNLYEIFATPDGQILRNRQVI